MAKKKTPVDKPVKKRGKGQKRRGAPNGNLNAEKWDIKTATEFMKKAVDLSKNSDYDFIGEVARDLGEYKGTFTYIVDKFPELKNLLSAIYANCEVNCFRNMKKENINVATGMINLKSNHQWTDRIDNTTKGEALPGTKVDLTILDEATLRKLAGNNG